MSDDEDPRLFDPDDDGRSHRDDPWTSFNAASSVKRAPQRLRVLQELRRAGVDGCTDSELGARLGIRETAAGTRRKELEERGLCQRTAVTRPTAYGNPALVHVITVAGLRALRHLVSAS
jgi:predicted ArsR family transcriptional regulator